MYLGLKVIKGWRNAIMWRKLHNKELHLVIIDLFLVTMIIDEGHDDDKDDDYDD
jgi:hypothetical protein